MGDSRRDLLTAGGPLLDRALAKRRHEDERTGSVLQREQSYREHVVAVYDAWCGLKSVYTAVIARVARRHGLTPERILQSSLLCVALHDLGKLTENFQRMMQAPPHDDGAYRKAVQQNFRHEVVPLRLIFKLANRFGKQFGPLPGGGLIETFAVAGHHKYLADDYLFDDRKFRNEVTWPDDDPSLYIQAGLELAIAMFREQGWQLPQDGIEELANPTSLRTRLCGQVDGVGEPYCFLEWCRGKLALVRNRDRRSAAAVRDLFVLLKGLLMTADWMASGGTPGEQPDAARDVVRVPAVAVREHLAKKEMRDGREPFTRFRDFQTRCGDARGHVLAVAPTGSGKTEAALLWALRQAEAGHARKLLFLLPTMVTTNSLYERMETFFKPYEHEVGLVHSTADLIREDAADEGDDARADVRASLLRERHFFPPVTVATVDQLLTPLLHSGRWAMKTLAAGGAAVVIDEIHAYDPHTAGLITLMIEQLRPLGTRFMVMSATMPKDLRETICRSLGGDIAVETIEDKELLDHARNLWSVRETPLSEWLLERNSDDAVPSKNIRRLLRETNDRGEPQRVLIVVNTVKRCQELAAALHEFDPVCYHSKFIFDDRREKERQILEQRPRLLIATQVVEVSLDIDYDVLLTECAPIDALVQRAGRVNRPRREALGRVVVHPAEESSGFIYDEQTLEATWEALRQRHGSCLTESHLAQLVEEVYHGRRLADELEYQAVRDAVPQHQERLCGVLDSPRPEEREALGTRLERYPQVSVIPSPFLVNVYDEECVRNPGRRRRYELKMSVWYFKEFKVLDGNPDLLPIVEMDYEPLFGGRFHDLAGRPPTSALFC